VTLDGSLSRTAATGAATGARTTGPGRGTSKRRGGALAAAGFGTEVAADAGMVGATGFRGVGGADDARFGSGGGADGGAARRDATPAGEAFAARGVTLVTFGALGSARGAGGATLGSSRLGVAGVRAVPKVPFRGLPVWDDGAVGMRMPGVKAVVCDVSANVDEDASTALWRQRTAYAPGRQFWTTLGCSAPMLFNNHPTMRIPTKSAEALDVSPRRETEKQTPSWNW
jgi:hypothetical protein